MPLDLGLDLKLFVAKTAGRLAAAAKEAPAVDACIRGLEEERRKIEVFRRELPLCARLLADVIEFMKEEAAKRSERRDADDNDKRKWMSTAQLWVDSRATDAADPVKEQRKESALSKPMLLGGAIGAPMAASCRAMPPPAAPQYFGRGDKIVGTQGLPALPMISPAANRQFSPPVDDRHQAIAAKFAAPMPPPGPGLQTHDQQSRKTRRCWSPELHRHFVAALHQLGGPQVATPKQIREMMKVDGLTNDEVKSHLQKYRLHNQRCPSSSSASHPVMLVGDLWAHQEQSSSQSRSPEGPLQLSVSGVAVSALTGSDSSEEDGSVNLVLPAELPFSDQQQHVSIAAKPRSSEPKELKDKSAMVALSVFSFAWRPRLNRAILFCNCVSVVVCSSPSVPRVPFAAGWGALALGAAISLFLESSGKREFLFQDDRVILPPFLNCSCILRGNLLLYSDYGEVFRNKLLILSEGFDLQCKMTVWRTDK
uniref:Two-component response regulator ARR2 n=1 Tax=Aegilops tauschii TaxID=37682 RepID=M8CYP1_AEGTA